MKMKSPQLNKPDRLPRLISRHAVVLLIALLVQAVLSSFDSPHKVSSQHFGVDQAPEWVLYSSVRNVDCFYRISNCSGQKAVFLKFNNRNTQRVKVSWNEVFKTQFEAQKEGFRGKKEIILPSGETSETDCTNIKVKELVVLPGQVNPTYEADIQQFNFKNITVVNL